MKALLSITPGGPETLSLSDIDKPSCLDDQVLIKVSACGINYPDALIIQDKYQFRPDRPFSPGGEIVGTIEEVGAKVERWSKGDRVIALVRYGGMAEFVTCSETDCLPIPMGMPDNEAAAFIFTYGTSYHALKDRANLAPGEKLLILGAAGGVGLAAVELGKAMGAEVLVGVSSEEKLQVALDKGADDGLVYPRGPFDKESSKALANSFKQLAGKEGANVIYDAIGGAYAEAALRSIAWEGHFLVVGFPAGIPSIPLNLPLLKGCQITGVFWGSFCERNSKGNDQNNAELEQMYINGKIKPLVSRTFTLSEASHGIGMLADRKATGKIVVEIP
tara:strand:- start:3366 stop:4364 length:999 start_codon:yes stop_codon:yes gene_type:complete